jgi:DUF971 family protein
VSFWESLKPQHRRPSVTEATLTPDQKMLELVFSDGFRATVAARTLRQLCPCAECVEEWSGKRTFDIETIPTEMKIIEVSPVGNYAITFTFGDLHRTGIFQWEYLRALAER